MSDFGLIWRSFCESLQIKNFFRNQALWLFYLCSLLTSCKKVRKLLIAVSVKTALLTNQPTNQLLPTTPILQDLADAGPIKKHFRVHFTCNSQKHKSIGTVYSNGIQLLDSEDHDCMSILTLSKYIDHLYASFDVGKYSALTKFAMQNFWDIIMSRLI